MKMGPVSGLIAAVLVAGSAYAYGSTRAPQGNIAVESPAHAAGLALPGAEAIYLHDTGDGRTLLYIEAQGGGSLSIVDVTDPASVRMLALVPIAARGSFDFMGPADYYSVIIRYRNGAGMALLNLKKDTRPALSEGTAEMLHARSAETLDQNALLLTVGASMAPPSFATRTYSVLDTSNPSRPSLLATIPAVKQRLSNPYTGTLFLLNREGVTMVRSLSTEAAFAESLRSSN